MSKDVNKVGTITTDITTEADIYEKKREKIRKVFFILFIILLSVLQGWFLCPLCLMFIITLSHKKVVPHSLQNIYSLVHCRNVWLRCFDYSPSFICPT